MITDFIERAKRGESVYLCDVRDAFNDANSNVECVIEPAVGEAGRWSIPLPCADTGEESVFLNEYFYAHIYNFISAFGGKNMTLYYDPGVQHIEKLCASLPDIFQTMLPRSERFGYGKCLNVTDRVNEAMGFPPFRFKTVHKRCDNIIPNPAISDNAVTAFQKAVATASDKVICGLDIGGTDIKVVATFNGRIAAFCEYDWYPAGMTSIDQLIEPIILMVRIMRTAISLPDTTCGNEQRAALLNNSASDEERRGILDSFGKEFGVPILFDGIGVGFPDVVIHSKIVGGETFKTRGIRHSSSDYETEFSELIGLNDMLLAHCKPGGVINITNDGSLAAYTAAVELAHSERANDVSDGVFAHTFGTELGTGWINECGEIPQIPLEIYNCVFDLGNYPARKFGVFDLRSTLNFNTGIAGTMQKYTSQSGAFRLALEYFSANAPKLRQELFDKGFIEEKEDGIYVALSPADMRKPLLEHIMELADKGQPQAEHVFIEIGRYLAAIYRETEFILNPKIKRRVLYGRFVKRHNCFKLMQKGAHESLDIVFDVGDESLAFTPLMRDLKNDPHYTVAQFGQAVGAVYFASSLLG